MLIDRYGRTVDYMRVSITDHCNLQCSYCRPEKQLGVCRLDAPAGQNLTVSEITEICRQAAALGIGKFKITGGEPLVHPGCVPLVRTLKAIRGITQVTLTTNGVLLERYARQLSEAGVDGVNVSLDTLDEAEYEQITGRRALADVRNGIEAARNCRIPLKINALLWRGREESWRALVELAKDAPLDVRFIEMMPIGCGKGFEPVSNREILKRIQQQYGNAEPDTRVHGNGPAVYVTIPGFAGSIGFISAVHASFCGGCNRIRLTCDGQLKPCLSFGEGVSIVEAVRYAGPAEIRRLIEQAVLQKPKGHKFEDVKQITESREMVKIGG